MFNKKNLSITLILFFISLIFLLFFYTIFKHGFEGMLLKHFLYDLGRLTGLIGFLFLSLLIFSGDTARFFDKIFGIDRIIKFQRKFSLFTAVFILSHPIFFILSRKEYIKYLIPNFAVIPLAMGILSLYIFIIIMICSQLYKRISYTVWQYLHILTYILFFLVLYHAINFGSDTGNTEIGIVIGILTFLVILGIIYRTKYKITHKRFKGYIQEIKKENENCVTIKIKPEKEIKFKSGQFCFLRLNGEKLYARHPFTISSHPEEKDLTFTIKIEGRFTKAISKLKKGEVVMLDGPFGLFTINNKEKDLVFIAGGVGITPFISMIKNRMYSEKTNPSKQNITIIYGTKTKDSLIFRNYLDSIKEKWFKKVYALSRQKIDEKGYENKRIDKEIIEKYVKNTSNSIFYICGPEEMKKDIIRYLKSLGVKKRDIVSESFFW
jgi:predicted ferric reductase